MSTEASNFAVPRFPVGKSKKKKRRSSILKTAKPFDEIQNLSHTDDKLTKDRRVSFCNTIEIKEFSQEPKPKQLGDSKEAKQVLLEPYGEVRKVELPAAVDESFIQISTPMGKKRRRVSSWTGTKIERLSIIPKMDKSFTFTEDEDFEAYEQDDDTLTTAPKEEITLTEVVFDHPTDIVVMDNDFYPEDMHLMMKAPSQAPSTQQATHECSDMDMTCNESVATVARSPAPSKHAEVSFDDFMTEICLLKNLSTSHVTEPARREASPVISHTEYRREQKPVTQNANSPERASKEVSTGGLQTRYGSNMSFTCIETDATTKEESRMSLSLTCMEPDSCPPNECQMDLMCMGSELPELCTISASAQPSCPRVSGSPMNLTCMDVGTSAAISVEQTGCLHSQSHSAMVSGSEIRYDSHMSFTCMDGLSRPVIDQATNPSESMAKTRSSIVNAMADRSLANLQENDNDEIRQVVPTLTTCENSSVILRCTENISCSEEVTNPDHLNEPNTPAVPSATTDHPNEPIPPAPPVEHHGVHNESTASNKACKISQPPPNLSRSNALKSRAANKCLVMASPSSRPPMSTPTFLPGSLSFLGAGTPLGPFSNLYGSSYKGSSLLHTLGASGALITPRGNCTPGLPSSLVTVPVSPALGHPLEVEPEGTHDMEYSSQATRGGANVTMVVSHTPAKDVQFTSTIQAKLPEVEPRSSSPARSGNVTMTISPEPIERGIPHEITACHDQPSSSNSDISILTKGFPTASHLKESSTYNPTTGAATSNCTTTTSWLNEESFSLVEASPNTSDRSSEHITSRAVNMSPVQTTFLSHLKTRMPNYSPKSRKPLSEESKRGVISELRKQVESVTMNAEMGHNDTLKVATPECVPIERKEPQNLSVQISPNPLELSHHVNQSNALLGQSVMMSPTAFTKFITALKCDKTICVDGSPLPSPEMKEHPSFSLESRERVGASNPANTPLDQDARSPQKEHSTVPVQMEMPELRSPFNSHPSSPTAPDATTHAIDSSSTSKEDTPCPHPLNAQKEESDSLVQMKSVVQTKSEQSAVVLDAVSTPAEVDCSCEEAVDVAADTNAGVMETSQVETPQSTKLFSIHLQDMYGRMADAVRRMQLRLNNVQYANCDVRITQGLEKWLAASRSFLSVLNVLVAFGELSELSHTHSWDDSLVPKELPAAPTWDDDIAGTWKRKLEWTGRTIQAIEKLHSLIQATLPEAARLFSWNILSWMKEEVKIRVLDMYTLKLHLGPFKGVHGVQMITAVDMEDGCVFDQESIFGAADTCCIPEIMWKLTAKPFSH